MSLTKIDLIDSLYEQYGIPRKECAGLVESVFEIIKDEMVKGNAVKIPGFGKWMVRKKKERRGRNPQTGKELMLDSRKVALFKSSPILRKVVNSGE